MDEQLIETFEAYLLLSESKKKEKKKPFVEMTGEKRQTRCMIASLLEQNCSMFRATDENPLAFFLG